MKKLLTVFAIALVLTLAIASAALAYDVPEGRVITWGEVTSITSISGHEIRPYDVGDNLVIDATCTTDGKIYFTCTDPNCEEHIHYLRIKAGHAWSSEVWSHWLYWGAVIEEPTCEHTGLAIDVCLICGATNPDKTRVIDQLPHVYSETTLTSPTKVWNSKTNQYDWWLGYFKEEAKAKYHVITAPTCKDEGDAWRVCLQCGYVDKSIKVSLHKLPHSWSDWTPFKDPTCWSTGSATRVCINCGMRQKLTYNSDPDYDATKDEKKVGHTADWIKYVKRLNEEWDGTMDPINEKKVQYDRVKEEDWLVTCYMHTEVYICKYCKSKPNAAGYTIHEKVKDYMPTTSHIWQANPRPAANIRWLTEIWGDELNWSDEVVKLRRQYAWDNVVSLKPTCLYEGYNLYTCIYDSEYGGDDIENYDDWPVKHNDNDPHRFHMVAVPATDHDWTEWILDETYVKDGVSYYTYVRTCNNCGACQEDTSKVKMSTTKKTLKVGKSFTLKAYVNGVKTTKNVKWTSSDKTIAKVSASGKVKALKKGTVTITATFKGMSVSCQVKVK